MQNNLRKKRSLYERIISKLFHKKWLSNTFWYLDWVFSVCSGTKNYLRVL